MVEHVEVAVPTSGLSSVLPRRQSGAPPRLEPELISAFAGVIAEKKFTGRRHDWRGAETDMLSADHLIGWLTGSSRQAKKYAEYVWVVAEDLVDSHWPEIESLAAEL